MLDLRKTKNDGGPDVKLFTDHIPSSTERGISNAKNFFRRFYIYVLLLLFVCILAKYPAIIGKFIGVWWHTFSSAFVAQQMNI